MGSEMCIRDRASGMQSGLKLFDVPHPITNVCNWTGQTEQFGPETAIEARNKGC